MNLKKRTLSMRMRGDDIKLLQQNLKRQGYSVTDRAGFFGKTTRAAVVALQKKNKLKPTGVVDEPTLALINNPAATSNTQAYIVKGTVASPDRAGVGGLHVRIIDRNVRGDVLLAETVTDERGGFSVQFNYSSVFTSKKEKPDLQACAYSGGVQLGASAVRYNASRRETLLVLLPANCDALPSEYESLTRALTRHYAGPLGDLRESGGRQEITYIANKTGWDARAVAMAVLADRFNRKGGREGIPSIYFYSLFRAGMPTDEDTVYNLSAATLETVWKNAVKQGIIPKNALKEIPGMVQRFQTLGAEKLLSGPAQVGVSSWSEMLATSGLSDKKEQKKFTRLYAAHRDDLHGFWIEASKKFAPDTVKRLQLDGKLAFLTINNAPLMEAIHGMASAGGLQDPLQLAQMGYHRASRWTKLLGNFDTPKEIPGKTPDEKKANYAAYLAAQVRLSYPTASIAEMIQSGDLPLTGASSGGAPDELSGRVAALLMEHQKGFVIGTQTFDQYMARHQLQVPDDVLQQIRKLQRVYQITPSDDAMKRLLKSGFHAAYHVVRYGKTAFLEKFSQDLGGSDVATQIYQQSLQVHSAVLNLAMSYLTAKNSYALGKPPLQSAPTGSGTGTASPWSSGQILQASPQLANTPDAQDVPACATLEELFGSMDFCSCDECQSILSPAAYLVDLLNYLDNCHVDGGVNTSTTPDTTPTVASVLFSRRPDIQYLPLTCENTNTVLPYIDVVNETLEYFVVHSLSLADYHGHDTGEAASEDLLASPQYVNKNAYKLLAAQNFPLELPFHQPLENLRRTFEKFNLALPQAMETLRKDDSLERPRPDSYGWRDIWMEELKLCRQEYTILTDSVPAGSAPIDSQSILLADMYGVPQCADDASVIQDTLFTIDNNLPVSLSNAKMFCRHLEISYEDLASILKTQFINPASDLLWAMEQLQVSPDALNALYQRPPAQIDAEFNQLLPTGAGKVDFTKFGGPENPQDPAHVIRTWLGKEDRYQRLATLIVLTDTNSADDPGNPASFDNVELMHAISKNPLDRDEFVRFLRFIRLWKKLGWTVAQTDAAICALGAGLNLDDDTNGFIQLLPRLGILARVIDMLDLTPDSDLLSLLACWSDIGQCGDNSLYQQLFLQPALVMQDAAFEDYDAGAPGLDSTQMIADHGDALRSAFGLTSDEYAQIVAALGYDTSSASVPYAHPSPTLPPSILHAAPGLQYNEAQKQLSFSGILSPQIQQSLQAASAGQSWQPGFLDAVNNLAAACHAALAPLTITNISKIYRRGWLARKLEISVQELLLLIALTGIDPFAETGSDGAAVLRVDPTNPGLLRLISLVQLYTDRSVSSSVLLYLIWNQDLSGASAPDPAQMTALLQTLRGDFNAIDAQFAATDDPAGDLARAQMALVYGSDTTDTFFSFLDDNLTLEVPFTPLSDQLNPAVASLDPDHPIVYDPFQHTLTYTGMLTKQRLNALIGASGSDQDLIAALDALFNSCQDITASFFSRFPELKPVYHAYNASSGTPDQKREALLAELQPMLSRPRKCQQALQRLSATVGEDLGFVTTLMNPASPEYPLHAAGHANQPLLNDMLAVQTPGLRAEFFAGATVKGATPISPASIAQNLAYSLPSPTVITPPFSPVKKFNYGKPGNYLPVIPASYKTISGRWGGKIEMPDAGFYNFIVEVNPADADSKPSVTLSLDGQAVSMTPDSTGTLWRNADPLQFSAGTLCRIELTVEDFKDVLSVQWETPTQPREVIPSQYLYPPFIFTPFYNGYTRFLKAASLATALSLTADEVSFFGLRPEYRINDQGQLDPGGDGWLNLLPVADNLHLTDAGEAAAARALDVGLLTPLCALMEFAGVKAAISPGDSSLLAVLQDPAAAIAQPGGLLYSITQWDAASLATLRQHFHHPVAASLAQWDVFYQVYEAMGLVKQMGIAAQALVAATTNDPAADNMRALQAALQALYSADDWRAVLKPINDEMRSMQRDALVAYILFKFRSDPNTAAIDTSDKLFEYFLMDVEMQPIMETSRIRHALSSVQLFIDRCLMNLEPAVSPSAIDSGTWEWMSRYRVWEANREVFLFPENWLDPELRDDKSPLFQEVESALLQSDITDDSATAAYLDYLAGLQEVAKLEPCGLCHVEGDPAQLTSDVDYVVARTAGAHRKYYFRNYQIGSWSPWEQIKLDIEDTPILPVVWQTQNPDGTAGGQRLLLFWLRLLKQAQNQIQVTGDDSTDLGSMSMYDNQAAAQTYAQANAQATVKILLCWSEYYNGKWQASKTSDPDNPFTVDTETPGQPFDRSHLRISFNLDSDNSSFHILVINKNNLFSGQVNFPGAYDYHFYNMHSLPEETPLGGDWSKWPTDFVFGPSVNLCYLDRKPLADECDLDTDGSANKETGGPFTLEYKQGTVPNECVGYENPYYRKPFAPIHLFRLTVPHHPLQKPFFAPFLFEDVQNVFWVTVPEMPCWIPDQPGYGVGPGRYTAPATSPRLTMPLITIPAEKFSMPTYGVDPRVVSPFRDVIGSDLMQQLVNSGSPVRQGLVSNAAVTIDGMRMGPIGSMTTETTMQTTTNE